jgi:hypothetical protein
MARFVHTGVLEPGSGIGEHYHNYCEEIFFAFAIPEAEGGGGAASVAHFVHNGRQVAVTGSACVPCRMGESHGVFNPVGSGYN